MSADLPSLRDQLLDPSGGLVYHLRAARHRRGLWAPFHDCVAAWLGAWRPERRALVIVGPNAGYALPAGFLARFDVVTALEPDPVARWLLGRRPDAGGLAFDRLDCLRTADGLAHLAARYPDAAILFSNVLGQIEAHSASWSTLLARHLANHAWASYHDVISTTCEPRPGIRGCVTSGDSLAVTLARFWDRREIELVDHGSFHLGGDRPHAYALWPITPAHWHLVEWAEHPGTPPQESAPHSPR